MTKITQINDRSAATAWSPIAEHTCVIALGVKVRDYATAMADDQLRIRCADGPSLFPSFRCVLNNTDFCAVFLIVIII